MPRSSLLADLERQVESLQAKVTDLQADVRPASLSYTSNDRSTETAATASFSQSAPARSNKTGNGNSSQQRAHRTLERTSLVKRTGTRTQRKLKQQRPFLFSLYYTVGTRDLGTF